MEKKQTAFAMFLRIACAKTMFCFSVGMFVSSKQYNYIFVFIICQLHSKQNALLVFDISSVDAVNVALCQKIAVLSCSVR